MYTGSVLSELFNDVFNNVVFFLSFFLFFFFDPSQNGRNFAKRHERQLANARLFIAAPFSPLFEFSIQIMNGQSVK